MSTTVKASARSNGKRLNGTLAQRVKERLDRGLAPPAEAYRLPHRDQIDWSEVPDWARPTDPELFEGCGHEG